MSLEMRSLGIPDIKIIRPKKYNDARGFFCETYNKKTLAAAGIELDFVQDNHSFSAKPGTIRGLHYQGRPFPQHKLVRVVSGRAWDAAVDIRRGSPTFGKWVAAEISTVEWNQILVPVGFANAICTLEPNTEVIYKVTDFYAPDVEFGIRWDDPELKIAWPVPPGEVILSDKDRALPYFKDVAHWL